ncbi:tandem-95 repeat protein [Novosphingobium album (ex Liu et al. 2023)]|uniref:Ig-like domain-containing protein n=1 Tax=Novosphingobium album (ex Liu et al. 2023) TaxID=3031130 RepID=A0ABT5WST9_9SPHN|nr:Ig-like domain-containing protein [Novosphingobium album (ex Liu et al. 2023)]MDE8653109.1 Ig-like domain-containing protein [Novosphingobium album (ex Liu et al. 2023)]
MIIRLNQFSSGLEPTTENGTISSLTTTTSAIVSSGVATKGLTADVIDAVSNGKLQFGLAGIFLESQIAVAGLDGQARAGALADFVSANSIAPVRNGYVTIDVAAANGDGSTILDDLMAIGLVKGSAFGALASGLLPLDAIDDLAALATIKFARPSYAVLDTGAVAGQDDLAIDAPAARSTFGVDGTGITVGVLSDSFDTRTTTSIHYAEDVASGDLPAGINVLSDYANGTDEGRGMAQLIYDIAPGVEMAFHTAFAGEADFAQGIIDLRNAGSDIIVDDVRYFFEPMFQDGVIAQAVDTVVADGAMYFSSAGNYAARSYESEFRNSGTTFTSGGVTYALHDFDPGVGVDTAQRITQSGAVSYILQWDDPFFSVSGGTGARSDMVFIFRDTGGGIISVIDSSTLGDDPIEFEQLSGSGALDVSIGFRTGLPGNVEPHLIKYVTLGGSQTFSEFNTASGTSFGHSNTAGANAVAAADWYDTPAYGQTPPFAENFTSKGGVPILFDTDGNRYISPQQRGVDFTAPDGSNTTFFGTDVDYDADTFPNFYGTSAAAPNAAALAALMMDYVPGASGARIEQALRDSALDILSTWGGTLTGAGFDLTTGAGLIQATAALNALANDAGVSLTVTRQTVFIDADNDGGVDSGEQLHTVTRIVNNGLADAANVTLSDPMNGATIDMGSVEITPIAIDDTKAGSGPIVLTFAELLANDIDPDGAEANLTIASVLHAEHGTVSFDAGTQTVTFTPTIGYSGPASFEYTIVDEDGHANVAGYNGVVHITVGVPDAAPGTDAPGVVTDANPAVTATIGALAAGKAVEVYYSSTVGFANEVIVNPAPSSAVANHDGGSATSNVETLTVQAVDTLSLGNLIFRDANANGVFDGGDSGIDGVTLSLFADADNNGTADGAAIATTTTAGGGAYLFQNLAPGNYIVSVDAGNFTGGNALAGLIATTNAGDPDNNINNDSNGAAGPGGTIVSGSVTLSYGAEPTGDGDSDADTNLAVDIGFGAPNQPPVNTLPATFNGSEDTPLVLTGISIADPDAGSGAIEVNFVIDPGSGTLTLATDVAGGVTSGQIVGNASGAIVVTATVAQINATLAAANGLTLTPAADFHGDIAFGMDTADGGNTGLGGEKTDVDTAVITISAVNDAPVITSDGSGDTAAINVSEGATPVTTVVAADVDADPITYSIAGGADQARFTIDGTTGALGFLVAPDFGAPTDAGANNVYDVIVRASDGTLHDDQAIAVTVLDAGGNIPPVAVADAYSVNEDNTLTVALASGVLANDTDADLDPLTAVLVSGAAHGTLTLNADGSFTYAPNADFHGEDTFTYKANDGTVNGNTATVTITVASINDAPVITSGGGGATAAVDVDENATAVATVAASDVDLDTLTYSIAGGADAAKFTINAATGALSFLAAPDFEDPGDAGADNVYDVIVRASDGTLFDMQEIAVTVLDLNELPVALDDDYSVSEDGNLTVPVAGVLANDSDDDADPLTAILVTDVAHGTLVLNADGSFTYAPDADFSGEDSFTYKVNDGTGDGNIATVTITVDPVNDAPVITSDGGGATATVDVAENTAFVTTVVATDVDLPPVLTVAPSPAIATGGKAGGVVMDADPSGITYSINGGADAAKFTIDGTTGALSFIATPDFENPDDSGGDNVYDVTVRASDGSLFDEQALAVTVTAANDAPVVTIGATAILWDQLEPGTTDSYSVSAFVAGENFTLAAATTLDFFEALLEDNDLVPNDSFDGFSGTFGWAIYAADSGTGAPGALLFSGSDASPVLADTGLLSLYGTDVFDAKISLGGVSLEAGDYWIMLHEGAWLSPGDNTPIFWISSGNDPDPDFPHAFAEDPTNPSYDATDGPLAFLLGNNTSDLVATEQVLLNLAGAIRVSDQDAGGGEIEVTLAVDYGVLNVAPGTTGVTLAGSGSDSVTLTGTLAQIQALLDGTLGATITYLAHTDDPPASASLTATVDDQGNTGPGGAMTDTAVATIQIEAINDTPAITSNGGGATAAINVNENVAAVTTVVAADPDGDTLTYAIVGGDDQAKFTINAATGALRFVSAPNFESPTDVGANNVYDVIVRASDGTLYDDQAIAVTVKDVNENAAPIVAQPIADQSSPEDGFWSFTLPAGTFSDPNGDSLTLSATLANGSPLPSWLTFNPATRNFSGTPPLDFNGTIDLKVVASDGSLSTSDVFTLTITPVFDPPPNSPPQANDDTALTIQNTTLALSAVQLLANDQDFDGDPLTIAAVFGASHGSVSLSGSTVVFTPEAGFTGTASFSYRVSDPFGADDTATVTVFVTQPPNHRPVVSPAVEGQTTFADTPTAIQVHASDPDGDPLTYAPNNPAHGSITANGAGAFVYTPDDGYLGTDTVVVTVQDGKGGSTVYQATILVMSLDTPEEFRLIATDGWAGEIGGNGTVFGTEGFQDITVLDVAGHLGFDPSFNAGNDIVRLHGDAADWDIVRFGSSAVLSDGDTVVTLPVGVTGLPVVFDDGVRSLVFDTESGTMAIGDQSFGAVLVPITADPDGTLLPGSPDDAAIARVRMAEDGEVHAGGAIDLFGTADGAETVHLTFGSVSLDPSFNQGGDTLVVAGDAGDFTAVVEGSNVILAGNGYDIALPVGPEGMDLAFDDGTLEVIYDTVLEHVLIGDQVIDATITPLGAIA